MAASAPEATMNVSFTRHDILLPARFDELQLGLCNGRIVAVVGKEYVNNANYLGNKLQKLVNHDT